MNKLIRIGLAVGALALTTQCRAAAPSEVIFCFDTEDFTCRRNADGIVTLAKICEDEGIKGHFMVVGYLADQLVKWGRQDAIDAIRRHYIGFHTLRHTLHPNILEISDDEDWEVSYRKLAEMENEGLEIVRRVFPGMTLWTSCPPGPSDSYIANRYYADQGFRMDLGASWLPDDLPDMWYCGLRRIPYVFSLEEFFPGGPWEDWDSPEQKRKLLDKLSGMRRFVIYAHPNRVHSNEYFDAINYNRANTYAWGEWQQPTPRDPAVVERWIRRVHEFIGLLKADPRFRITSLPEVMATEKPRVPITPDNLPGIRASLERDFGPVREPANWSVAEIFVAVTHFLDGGKVYMPGDVGGFLEKPVGIAEPCAVSRTDVVRAAKALKIGRYLPTRIDIGGRTVGPADYLFAALKVLTTDAETVTLAPREQLGSFRAFPKLEKCARAGKWLYWPEYKDRYTCDRMRWQLWTFRYE